MSHQIECDFCKATTSWGAGQQGWYRIQRVTVYAFTPTVESDVCPDCIAVLKQRCDEIPRGVE